jgi:uncharacterized protein
MEKDKYETFGAFTKDGTNIEDGEFVEQLKAGRFLIKDDCDELDYLRFRMLASRYNTATLGLTIAPTADCNFRCAYCYEKDVIKQDCMGEEVQQAIVDLVSRQAKSLSQLSVAWYGGEPLMAIDVVERLSREFLKICEENDIEYNASIVTNGYLITGEILELLNELKITSMQITLDGFRDVHDARRPFEDGSGTFDVIINNLRQNKDILPNVTLRVNTDRENPDAVKHVAALLDKDGLSDKVRPYLGRIMSENDGYDGSKCFNVCDFAKEDFSHYRQLHNDENFMSKYPRLVGNACTADRLNSFVIGADGGLYGCWVDIGKEGRAIGHLLEKAAGQRNDRLFLDYMLFDPTTNTSCSACKLLPVCMGSCPYRRMLNDADRCSGLKYVLRDYLDIIAGKLKASKGSAFFDK